MQSTIVKHTIVINGRKTSISLEDAFWAAFKRDDVPAVGQESLFRRPRYEAGLAEPC